MGKYADVKNGNVVNVCEASPEVAAERGWIECVGYVQKGMTYDEATKKFSKFPQFAGHSGKQRDPVLKAKQKNKRDLYDLPDNTPVTIGQLKSLGLLGNVGEADHQALMIQHEAKLRAAGLDDDDLREIGVIE